MFVLETLVDWWRVFAYTLRGWYRFARYAELEQPDGTVQIDKRARRFAVSAWAVWQVACIVAGVIVALAGRG